ncbi:ABC transporter ATP-binding protein/permease [Defluviimonas sp. WL0002]|uniref:ABC transporter ATP-binding protein/permease n=1 Tax=Albidovulum marisflavi TaxID=2984159 RepID=A0ABT2ZEB4_9RHOB|nr:ABC transporter ATP-binding protein [Defluviimonas sp. WL0002]MCV2869469.1 ABC transporter ATP-binding protein/permease [Defluviimonas sp. WL0002]
MLVPVLEAAPNATSDYTSRRLFNRLWRAYLRPHRGSMALAVLLMIIEGSTLAFLSYALKPLFDRVFVGGEIGAIWIIGSFILSLFLIRAATSVASRALLTSVAQRTAAALQVDLLRHILTLEGGFFQTNSPGQLIERVQGDTAAVQGVWTLLITGFGRDAVALVALAIVAIMVDPVWALVAVVGTPLLILPAVAAQRYIRRKVQHLRHQSERRATRLDEIFHGITAIKLNRIEGYQLDRFTQIISSIVSAETKSAASRAAIPALIDVVTGIGFFAVIMFGGAEIASGERTVGDFMAFFSAMSLAFQPMRRLGDMAGQWQIALVSLRRIYGLFDRVPAVRSRGAASLPEPADTGLRLTDVRLSYGDHEVLRGVTFTAEAGKTTALVGPSGAGKSTIFNLLTRLVDPQSGTIELGGTDIQHFDLDRLRDQFSVVSQDSSLFDESIRENILLGHTGIDDAALSRALEAAHVAEFAQALPLGLDTPAGPRGSSLSGGQRQRVAIARAVLRDAPILLLDEATSALDATSERLVQDALDRLSAGRTTLVIAHRLATVRNADKIVVLEDGAVVEVGTHDTLLARDGLYASLCRLQFSDEPRRQA